jgi:hypothetical protein
MQHQELDFEDPNPNTKRFERHAGNSSAILSKMVGNMQNPLPGRQLKVAINRLGDSDPVDPDAIKFQAEKAAKEVKKPAELEKKSEITKPVEQFMEPETEDEKQEKLKKRIDEIRSEIHGVMMVKPLRNTKLEDLWGRYYAKDTYSLPFEVNSEETRAHLTTELKGKIDQHNSLVAMVKREAPKPRADDELSEDDINRAFGKSIVSILNFGKGW